MIPKQVLLFCCTLIIALTAIRVSSVGQNDNRDKGEGRSRYPIAVNGKFGYIDNSGAVVIPPRYEAFSEFHEGVAIVRRGGKQEYIDENGEPAIPCRYERCQDFSEGAAVVWIDEYHCSYI